MSKTITPGQLCQDANAAFARLQKLKAQVADIQAKFAEDSGIEADSYRNPFHFEYEVARVIEAVRGNLAKFLVQRLNEILIPNIPLDVEQLPRNIPELREQFDAQAIFDHIQQNYVKNAVGLSYQAIFARARRLLPRAGWKDELTLSNVLKGNVLTLRKYIRPDCAANCSFIRDDECDCFQKLVRIVLEDANPVTVTAGATPISQAMARRKYDEIPQLLVFDDGWIKQLRCFKNGRMLVAMKAESSARRVAVALLEKPKDN
jgi:hypothetical protein